MPHSNRRLSQAYIVGPIEASLPFLKISFGKVLGQTSKLIVGIAGSDEVISQTSPTILRQYVQTRATIESRCNEF